MRQIQKIIVLGAGSAGLLAALAYKRALPEVEVTILRSPDIPVIGVGESTTVAVPQFLHNELGIDPVEFHREVTPIWKLGNRFIWGDPKFGFFDYSFERRMDAIPQGMSRATIHYLLNQGMRNFCITSSLMEQNRSPFLLYQDGRLLLVQNFGYHIENKKFLSYLEKIAVNRGIQIKTEEVSGVKESTSGEILHLKLKEERTLEGDLFIDCSGFGAELIEKVHQVPKVVYSSTLFSNHVVIGSWEREHPIQPFTTSETMDNGWCWNIEFEKHITRGYVFSSDFCSVEEAMQEMKKKNPQIGDDLRSFSFPSFRREKYWVKNVIAIGNSSGFVEPLEATALHCIVEQIRASAVALKETQGVVHEQMREGENKRFRQMWDDIRDFIALHYKFNHVKNTKYWKQVRNETSLGGAEEFVKYFQDSGPSILSNIHLYPMSLFGFEGYMSILLGQQIKTKAVPELSREEVEGWKRFQDHNRELSKQFLSVEDALRMVRDPKFQWPTQKA